MFDIKKFGGYLSRLRKKADMTQSELAEKLSVTRQAVSQYERGDSFPDVSILVIIADLFGITLDELISSGEPTRGESIILEKAALGNESAVVHDIADLIDLAPLLKPSLLDKLSGKLATDGIDISHIVALAEFLNEETILTLIENTTSDTIDCQLLERLMPMLDSRSKEIIFEKILDGRIDWHFIKALIPHAGFLWSQIEAAVIEGVLPWEALDILRG